MDQLPSNEQRFWELGLFVLTYACFWMVTYPCVARFVLAPLG